MENNSLVPTVYVTDAVISSGQASTAAISTDWSKANTTLSQPVFSTSLVGVYLPAGFTGTGFTVQASQDNSTFFNIVDNTTGAPILFMGAAGQYVPVDPIVTCGVHYFKIVSDANQASSSTIRAAMRRVL